MAKLTKEFSKGIIAENPVLRLVLGTCPTLATTTSVESAIGMGLAASGAAEQETDHGVLLSSACSSSSWVFRTMTALPRHA